MTAKITGEVCPRCNGEGWIDVPSDDPQLPRDLVSCPCCHGRPVTKAAVLRYERDRRQAARDNAAPPDSPPDVARLYR